MAERRKSGMEGVAKALGLDPSASKADLIKQANALKQQAQALKRMVDCRHLLEDEVATDCIIQVYIPSSSAYGLPQAKRVKINKGMEKKATAPVVTTKTIKAHALILSKQSEYFKAMMMKGKWAESQDKMLEIELGSEQEFDAFKLLMELSYGATYTRQGGDGPTFPRDSLMALIIVANIFEFTYCIEQCCDEMGHGLTSDNALGVIDFLAPLDPLREPIKELLDKAMDLIGPLEKLWTQGPFCEDNVYASSPKLKAITTIDSMIYLLKSDRLQMESENITFTLVHWWLEYGNEWTQEQKQQAFNKIMDSNALRFHYIDPIYLAAYAMRTHWMQDWSHLGTTIFQQSLLTQNGSEMVELGKKRVTSKASPFIINVPRRVVESLQPDQSQSCFMGFMAGFPMFFSIETCLDDEEEEEADTYIMVSYVGWSSWGLNAVTQAEREVAAVVKVEAMMSVGGIDAFVSPLFLDENKETIIDYRLFDSPWEKIIAPNSLWFDDEGNMKVKIVMRLAR